MGFNGEDENKKHETTNSHNSSKAMLRVVEFLIICPHRPCVPVAWKRTHLSGIEGYVLLRFAARGCTRAPKLEESLGRPEFDQRLMRAGIEGYENRCQLTNNRIIPFALSYL